MSNLADGAPAFVLYSLANFGSARTQGLELGSTTRLRGGWRTDVTYTWFDFALDFDPRELALLPNTPRHEATATLSYANHAFDAGVAVRWIGAFDWASGVYVGPVPAYTVVDLNADYPFAKRMTIGVGIANVLDNSHYELFGGDVLGRRALAHLAVSW
jgi:outer membrane receptor protein involved in Fe transport